MTVVSNFDILTQANEYQILKNRFNTINKLSIIGFVAIAIFIAYVCFYKYARHCFFRLTLTPPQFRIKLIEAKDEILRRMFTDAEYARHSAAKIFVQVGTADHFLVNRAFVLNGVPTREAIDRGVQSIFNQIGGEARTYPHTLHCRIGMILKDNITFSKGTATKRLFENLPVNSVVSQGIRNSQENQEFYCNTFSFPFEPFALD
ncbi:MAG: hypothetical protein H0V82_06580 [Candidatus Protochlamydia sp.]|nr:hypothetical protein [Candidatus Protochlamydia sp.]